MALQEVQNDPFNPEEFVERLAWKATNGKCTTSADFDPMSLHQAFEKMILDLKEEEVRVAKRAERLETQVKEEEKKHRQRVSELQKQNQTAFAHYQRLDEQINFVATKVVHLGDLLEGANIPRTRTVEAQTLMNYFAEFLSDEPPTSPVFKDPFHAGSAQLQAAADVIQKLYVISQEIPQNDRFNKAREGIAKKYDEIEMALIEDFVRAHNEGQTRKMKKIALVLSNFKGYNQCIDAFIEESQRGAFLKPGIFDEILPLCEKTSELINEVFINPEAVMTKFVLNIYHRTLQEHITSKLTHKDDAEEYLNNLYDLYTRTVQLSKDLSTQLTMGSDTSFLQKSLKSLFGRYLDTYISVEMQFLKERLAAVLQRYYDSKSHQKRQIQTGTMHDFRREMQAKMNINIGAPTENYSGETFLSHEVAINVLQESKMAFKRCQALSSQSETSNNAVKVFDCLVQYLCIEHIDYAIELGLQAIPLPEPKSTPDTYFFAVVGDSNTIFHLFEKQFNDNLVPLISSSPRHSECLQRKRELMEQMENKLDIGLDRTIQAVVGWIKYVLSTEQKRTDFKPENEEAPMLMYSQACIQVVKYVHGLLRGIRESLDGKNLEAVLTELGIRFHRVVYEHLLQFQYNSLGAMLAICDVNEYRKCVKEFGVLLVTQLFDTLHSLCNLLVVVPENLKQVCTGEHVAGLDKNVMMTFIQLRTDYKTAKLANQFK
ncbi:exocyst complex component 5 [Lingula anatina]|uniref:Exocyst complex component 5 n=1 Tax=Lingula anatina TaxID=7574 RepID=A0A1S3J2C1_LINAN|nr:exocyst complex component 5 [Lingula anatina]|eukprot:XP_013404550.1 exocyst complex component 5 [Lingula anatina]